MGLLKSLKNQLNEMNEREGWIINYLNYTKDQNLIRELKSEFNQIREHKMYLIEQLKKETSK